MTEPPDSAAGHRNRAIAGVVLAMAIAAFNQTSVATSLPLIVADLGSLRDYSWVLISSLVPAAVSAPAFGAAADMWGRRTVFVTGVVLFCIGAIGAGSASGMEMLLGARVIHGIGMGGMMTLSQTLVADLIPPERRGTWLALLGGIFGAATMAGPLLGGWIADEYGWRWVFFASVPPAVVAVPVIWTFLRVPAHPSTRRIDIPGIAAVSLASTAALLALLWGGVRYAWGSPEILGLAALAVVGLPVIWKLEIRRQDPLVDLSELRLPVVALCTIAAALAGGILFGTVLFVPLYLQGARGASVTESGLWLLWFIAAFVLAAVIAGRLAVRRNAWGAVLVGGGLTIVPGVWLAGMLQADGTALNIAAPLVVLGAGLGMVMPVILQLTQAVVEPRRVGRATALHQFVRSFGGAVGIAVMGALVNNRIVDAVRARTPDALEQVLGDLSHRDIARLNPNTDRIADAYVIVAALRTALHDVVTQAFREITVGAALLVAVCILLARRLPDGAYTGPDPSAGGSI